MMLWTDVCSSRHTSWVCRDRRCRSCKYLGHPGQSFMKSICTVFARSELIAMKLDAESEEQALISRLRRLASIDIRRPAHILSLRKHISIVMVGGMCAGKSTLAHGAALAPALVGCCEVVPRCTTRPARRGDDSDGVSSISWNDFSARRDNGSFALSWERPLSDGSRIGYGCYKPVGDGAPIFMAGHGVYSNRETVQPPSVLERALIVGVAAPDDVRMERLRLRSPDVLARGRTATEMLLAHDDATMANNVDIIVNNYHVHEEKVINDFRQALILVLGAAGYPLRYSGPG
jgi:ribose 1,5-bisphosphokinase PhnN